MEEMIAQRKILTQFQSRVKFRMFKVGTHNFDVGN